MRLANHFFGTRSSIDCIVAAHGAGCRGAGDHEGQEGGSLVLEGNQWRRGLRHPPPPKLSENLLLVRNFSSKNANCEA